jgi:predicted small metal-binding protein
MTISTICKACGTELHGADEGELVTAVQQHIAEAHDRGHRPSREQILAVIRRRLGHEG